MNIFIKAFNFFINYNALNHSVESDHYCNDPIVISDLGRRIEHKEAFFNLYVKSIQESSSSFHIYLARMIRGCRLHMLSLPIQEQQSFVEFCLSHKIDISDDALRVATSNEVRVINEIGSLNFSKS